MSLKRNPHWAITFLLLTGCAPVTANAPSPAPTNQTAAPIPASSEPTVTPRLVASPTLDQRSRYNLSVAYSSADNSYLLVWEESGKQSQDIYAWRLDAKGNPMGDPFLVTTSDSTQSTPRVVYNSRSHEYLVIWADDRGNALDQYDYKNADLYARRISPTGQLLGDELLIANQGYDERSPNLSFSDETGEYIATWVAKGASVNSAEIQGQRLSRSGTRIGSLAKVAIFPNQVLPLGTYHLSYQPIYNPMTKEYFTAWQNPKTFKIEGQRLTPDLKPIGQSTSLVSELTELTDISLGNNPRTGEYLISWNQKKNAFFGDLHVVNFKSTGDFIGKVTVSSEAALGYQPAWMPLKSGVILFWTRHFYQTPILQKFNDKAQLLDAVGGASASLFSYAPTSLAYNTKDDTFFLASYSNTDHLNTESTRLHGFTISPDGQISAGESLSLPEKYF